MSPTSRAAALVALAGLVALVWVPLGALTVIAIAIATVVDMASVRRPIAIRCETPPTASRGRPIPLSVAPTESDVGRLTLRQPVPADVSVTPQQADGSLDAVLVATRRGRHSIPAPGRRREGPLGLGARYDSSGEPADLKVYPDMVAAHRIVSALRAQRFSQAGLRMRGPLGLGTEFESVRDYAPDDDFRQINWRATARTGRPMSNQYRVEHDRDVVCLVDAGRLMRSPLGDRTRLDAAVDGVAAVATVAEELDDRCGVIAFDSELKRSVRPHRRSALAVVEAIYDLEPSGSDSDYELVFRHVATDKRALVLLLTDLLDEAAARSLLEAMPVLVRRHSVAVASALDTDLENVVRGSTSSPLDAYRIAVATDVLERRRTVKASLAAAGAQVVEATPDRLGAACVDAYLRAKARARL